MTDEHACNLTDHLREQARDLAGDNGNAPRRIEWSAAAEIDRLRAIVDRLPVYADTGEPMLPGDLAHEVLVCRRTGSVSLGLGQIAMYNSDEILDAEETKNIGPLYSTREAAEAAAKESQR